jgi:hypothetical protein
MTSWRDQILKDFVPGINRLTLVADPDGLLTEERMVLKLRELGFDLIEFTDSIAFRYAYESQYRALWDQGLSTDLVVVLRLEDSELDRLPYDLLQSGKALRFSLGDLFPHFSYRVLTELDRSLLDKLFVSQHRFKPESMGENLSKDFILRHVYRIAPEMIDSVAGLISVLLKLHYGRIQLPKLLAERWARLLSDAPVFEGWDLLTLISDEQAFYGFLQERWPLFLANITKNHAVYERFSSYGLKYAGPDLIPFEHHDIYIYIDNLFVEGKLKPIRHDQLIVDKDSWMRVGLLTNTVAEDLTIRFKKLLLSVENQLVNMNDANHSDWAKFAAAWAELVALAYGKLSAIEIDEVKHLRIQVDFEFSNWLEAHFGGLINLPPGKPVMVHHAVRYLTRALNENPHSKVALIVMDGLALNQWVTLKTGLSSDLPNIHIREKSLFAWVPSVTSVSRQAIFSGKIPMYFSSSIDTTNAEEKHWLQYWEDAGLNKSEVVYQRSLGSNESAQSDLDALISSKTRVVGLVVDSVDKIMHGMQLGNAGMHNQVNLWMKSGYLKDLISELVVQGFDVWLTADHGNIEATGCGRPKEGVLADTRGERMRVYKDKSILEQVAGEFSFAKAWDPVGLPDNYFPLVISGDEAFITKGEKIVGHGGISLEEIVVPWIHFEKSS